MMAKYGGASSRRILWLGGVFPPSQWGCGAVSPAAQRWQTSLITAIEASGNEVICVGHRPARLFPRGPVSGRVTTTYMSRPSGAECTTPSFAYLNVPLLRYASLALGYLYVSVAACVGRRSRPTAVISYNLYPYCVLAAAVLSKIFAVTWLVVLADFIGIPSERLSARAGRRYVGGVVALSERLARSFPPPSIVVPGGVEHADGSTVVGAPVSSSPVIGVYAGSLEPSAGVGVLVRALPHIEADDLRIIVLGHGDGRWIQGSSSGDERLDFRGFVPEEDLPAVMREADFFLAPRERSSVYGEGTFPSKVLSYLAYRKPILVSPEGLPADFADCLTVVTGTAIEWAIAIDRQVDRSRTMPNDVVLGSCLDELAAAYTWKEQAHRVLSFLDQLDPR